MAVYIGNVSDWGVEEEMSHCCLTFLSVLVFELPGSSDKCHGRHGLVLITPDWVFHRLRYKLN